MTKAQEIYRDVTLQTTNVLLTLTRLMIRRAQIVKKTPDRKDLIKEFDDMIENLENVKKAEEYKTLRLKVQQRQIFNRDKKIRELEYDLKKANDMNTHLLDGI